MAAKPKKKKNGTRYNQDAIELARSLYCKYGGKNLDAVQREMRKAGYPGWLKTYLFDKGRDGTAHYRMGWITKYGFDNSLRMHLEKLVESVNDDEQDLYVGIKATRKELQKKITGKAATKDELYQYRDFCKLEIEARKNLDLSRDNLETFVSGYEKLTDWAPPDLKKLLVKYGEKLVEMAQAHYGKSEEVDDGASPGEDEGGEQPGSSVGLVG
jgi:hypothetical protein